MASKRIPAKVRAEAIECLLTCAAEMHAGRRSPLIYRVGTSPEVVALAEIAYSEVADLHPEDFEQEPMVPFVMHRYHAAASLLDAGYEP